MHALLKNKVYKFITLGEIALQKCAYLAELQMGIFMRNSHWDADEFSRGLLK